MAYSIGSLAFNSTHRTSGFQTPSPVSINLARPADNLIPSHRSGRNLVPFGLAQVLPGMPFAGRIGKLRQNDFERTFVVSREINFNPRIAPCPDCMQGT